MFSNSKTSQKMRAVRHDKAIVHMIHEGRPLGSWFLYVSVGGGGLDVEC